MQDVQSCLKAVVIVMHEVTYVAGLRPALGVVSEFTGKVVLSFPVICRSGDFSHITHVWLALVVVSSLEGNGLAGNNHVRSLLGRWVVLKKNRG